MLKLDMIGKNCPIPVIEAKKTLANQEITAVLVLVDNKIATENLTKLAEQLGYNINVKEINKEYYEVSITKDGNQAVITADGNKNDDRNNNIGDIAIVICTEYYGDGNNDLGEALMKSYIYTLTEMEILPKYLIFCNGGVTIPVTNSDYIENLTILEDSGVEILACGACLNFYNLSDKLGIGTATNMYNISDILMKVGKVIKI